MDKSFNLKVVVTRFVNIYGPGDKNWKRLIPGVIKSIIENRKPIQRASDQTEDIKLIIEF